jgi:hypothetical protein
MSLGKQFPQIDLEVLYAEALKQWQKHITGIHPVSAGVIVGMSCLLLINLRTASRPYGVERSPSANAH